MTLVSTREIVRPAFLSIPATATGHLGDEVAEMALDIGQQVDEEERIILAALSPIKDDGLPAGLEAAAVAGRRQIKSWAMEMLTFYEGWVLELPQITWTAHLTRTSDANFRHMVDVLRRYKWLRDPVARWYEGNGNHSIIFKDGRRVDFIARGTGRAGRGEGDINRLILDEWLYGTEAMAGAMIPAMGAATNRYVRYASSPGLLSSSSLRQVRERGRRGGDPSLAYIEWTSERLVNGRRVIPSCLDPECMHLPGVAVGCVLDDQSVIRANNPAYGRRLSEEFVAQERLALSPVEYGRERAGLWEDPPNGEQTDAVLAKWPDALTADGLSGPVTLGVSVSADSRSAAITACAGGVLEVVDYRMGAGTEWLKDRIVELRERHSVSAVARLHGTPATAVDLGVEDVDICTVAAGDVVKASIRFVQDINGGLLRHRGQQSLDIAVKSAVRTFAGDGWRWSLSRSTADISPLHAAVAAHWLGLSADPLYDVEDSIY